MIAKKEVNNILQKINKNRKFNLKKALFILPNAFTVASIFCGSYAILNTIRFDNKESLYQSAIAVFFAGFFDMFDGRVARLTKTQSEFGVEIDSLADLISFGVAPSVIVYKWALWPIGPWGIFASFCFMACGAIRLARFNVLARSKEVSKSSSDYFIGLPIPVAASLLVAVVIAHFKLFAGLPVIKYKIVLAFVLFMAFLMVSNIKYPSFKKIKFGKKTILFLFSILIVLFIAGQKLPMSVILVSILGSYIIVGFLLHLWRFFVKMPEKMA